MRPSWFSHHVYGGGIAYRWFSTILALWQELNIHVLSVIRFVGVEKFSQIPAFGYVAKRFSAFFNPFNDLARQDTSSNFMPW